MLIGQKKKVFFANFGHSRGSGPTMSIVHEHRGVFANMESSLWKTNPPNLLHLITTLRATEWTLRRIEQICPGHDDLF